MSDGSSTESETTDPAAQPLLFCLDGNPAPAELGPALAYIRQLPESAQEHFDQLLLPTLGAEPEDQLDSRLSRMARHHELDLETLAPAVKAARLVLRQAAAYNLTAEQVSQDVQALTSDTPLAQLLATLYEGVLLELRREIARVTLAAHGRVLTGVEWRIDTIGSGDRGRALDMPVALMTFQYQDGETNGRITLQMVPEMVEQLRQICGELLS